MHRVLASLDSPENKTVAFNESFLKSEDFLSAETSLAEYLAARSALRDLGVIRSDRTVQSDYGEWLACKLFGLTPAVSGVQAGYDATDDQGQTYQIKTRLVTDLNATTSFDFKGFEHRFDYLIGVLLSRRDSRLLAIVQISYPDIATHARIYRSRRSFRWKKSCWSDPWVTVLYKSVTAQ